MSEKPTGTPVEKYRPSDVYIFPTLIRNVMQFFPDSAILISFIILCSSVNYHPSLFGRVIGDVKRLPDNVQQKLRETEEHTAKNDAMTMVVALSYSSRWEITEAVRQITIEGIQDITEETISQHLTTNFMPDPDLLIRTGGEVRISNYLLWQIAYSELYFCDTYWPDFDEAALHKAIESYQKRQRRYGKTEEQVENEQ